MVRRAGGPARTRAAAVSIAALIAAVALCATALAATGDLNPEGCIDDNDTGPDTCFKTADGLNAARAVAVSPDGKSVYVVSGTDDAIVRFDRDPATGVLTPKGCIQDNDTGTDGCAGSTDGLRLPFSVAVSPDGTSVYVAARGDSAITRFKRNTTTGALTPKGCVDDNDTGADACAEGTDGLGDVNGVAVSLDGESVYAVSITDAAIVRFDRNLNSGGLVPKGCIEDNDTGSGDCADTADGLGGAFSVAVSPDGANVYTTALDDSAIGIFGRNQTSGKLTAKDCFDDAAGPDTCGDSIDGISGTDGIAISPDGESLYVTAINSNSVARFNRNANSGGLTSQACVEDDAGPGPCDQSMDGLGSPTGIAVSPDGKSVYAGATGDDDVAILKRAASGALTPRGCVDDDTGPDNCAQTTDGLNGAAGVAVSPGGTSVYTVSVVDQAIVRFARDAG
jgi:DNA-binding beta-propeller fold protein YncE